MKKLFPPLEYANVPNFITSLGLLSGIIACTFVVGGDLKSAVICIFVATLMDVVDGFAASKMNRQTKFGQYLDLLTDFFVCCGIPVLMLFTFTDVTILTAVAAIVYAVCGLWRLAYFISVTAAENQPFFTGLPAPAAMLLAVASVWLFVYYGIFAWICPVVFSVAGLLMISSFKFKKYGICQKILGAVWLLFLVAIAVN